MKKTKAFSNGRNIIVAILLSIPILTNSCTKKIIFQESTIVPAARGTIQIKSDNNNNYDINVKFTDLAEASRSNPAKSMYIVWILTDEDITKNIGQLKIRIFKRVKSII
jgi:hypothetical protein